VWGKKGKKKRSIVTATKGLATWKRGWRGLKSVSVGE